MTFQFQIQWIDFGCTETVPFAHLSKRIGFAEIPIQVKKFHLSGITLISDQKTAEARAFCSKLLCNQFCVVYVHDNDDVEHHDSIACAIQLLNLPLDLASLLISRGFVQYKLHSDEARKSQIDSKRIRQPSEEPIIKNRSELKSFEDFEEFYRTHKAKNPLDKSMDTSYTTDNNKENDSDNRVFEIFEPVAIWSPVAVWENAQEKPPTATPHPILDRITQHFTLMTVKRSAFECRCACIIDPVTLLIKLLNVKPTIIHNVDEQSTYFPLQGTTLFCI